MKIVDSHCHLDRLDLTEYDNKLNGALAKAKELHVTQMLCVCIDLNNFEAVWNIAQAHSNIHASVGVHPTEQNHPEVTYDQLIELAKKDKVIAIGETGLDYFHCEGDITWQQERFRTHIKAAITAEKPLIIHTRDAREDTIKIMQEESAAKCGGVMHCFTETWEMAQAAIEMGFYISFSGIVTFKNAKELQAVAQKVPLDKMLIETDSPYLAPTPYRGKSNQPAYTYYVAEKIAELRDTSIEKIAEATTKNYYKLFKI